MKILSQLAILGAIAVGGLTVGALPASASCAGAGGGMDCPLDPSRPLGWQNHDLETRAPAGVYVPPVDTHVDRPVRNPERYNHRRYNGRHLARPNVYGGYRDWYGDDYYYVDRSVPAYRYVEPRYERRYVQPRYRVQELSAAHVEYCYNKYRSYRVSDNTYNPGKKKPRRQCISPYI